MNRTEAHIAGWREWLALPTLGITQIKAKLDTGARTSVLHAFNLESFRRGGEEWVRFNIHPSQRDDTVSVTCEAPVIDRREVMNSGGHREPRIFIETEVRLGDDQWSIEISLTNRDEMGFRMLLGRSAMKSRIIVDPRGSYRLGKKKRPAK